MPRSVTTRRLRLARPSAPRERLGALFLLGVALFSPPLLVVASRPDFIGPVPFLYAWAFGGWLALIALLALVVERPRHDGE